MDFYEGTRDGRDCEEFPHHEAEVQNPGLIPSLISTLAIYKQFDEQANDWINNSSKGDSPSQEQLTTWRYNYNDRKNALLLGSMLVFGENWQDAFDEIGLSKFAATKEVVEKVINHVNKRGIDGQNIPIEEAIRQMKSIAPLGDILEAVDKDDYGRRYLEAEEFLNKVFGRSLSGAIKALDIHGDFGAECQEVSRLYEILVRNPS